MAVIMANICHYFNSHSDYQWSTDGCEVIFSDDEQTICQCNHLTNFALIMDIYEVVT